MEEDEKKETIKVKPLNETIRSFVEWKKAIDDALRTQAKFLRVVVYTIDGKDEVLNEIQPLPATSANKEENKTRKEQLVKFKEMKAVFIAVLSSHMSMDFRKQLQNRGDEYKTIVQNSDTRGFWELVKQVIVQKNKTSPKIVEIRDYLNFSFKQFDKETLSQFAGRLEDVVEQLQLLGEAVPKSMQSHIFLRGVHSKYHDAAQLINRDPLSRDKPIFEIADRVGDIVASDKMQNRPDGKERDNKRPLPSDRDDVIAATKTNNNDNDKRDGKGRFSKKSKSVVCWGCHKPGHLRKDCKESSSVNSNLPSNSTSSNYFVDTLASLGVTKHVDALENVTEKDRYFKNANGAIQHYRFEGEHPVLGRMAFLENAPMEIASFEEIRKKYRVSFNDDDQTFLFRDRRTGEVVMTAKRVHGFYPIKPIMDHPIEVEDQAIEELIIGITQKTTSDKLMELHERLLHSNYENLKRSIALGHYSDVISDDIKSLDWKQIQHCVDCKLDKDGRLSGQERGKDYVKRRSRVKFDNLQLIDTAPEPKYSLTNRIDARLFFDLVYVGEDICLLMLVKPHNYLLMTWITKRDIKTLLDSVEYLVNKARANGIDRIISISVDREKAVHAIEQQLVTRLGVQLKQAVPYKHERNIERQVRTVRNRFRCVIHGIKIPLIKTVKRLAWEHAVSASNFIMNTSSGDYIPYQIQHLTKEYRTPPKFGDFVAVSVGVPSSKEAPRNQVGMIVGFEELTRAVKIKFKNQKQIFIRDSYSVLDQEEGLRRYKDDEEWDDDEVDEAANQHDRTEEDAFGEIVDNENIELGEGEIEHEPTIQHSATESESTIQHSANEIENSEEEEETPTEVPMVRRSTRQPKPNQQEGFIYDSDEVQQDIEYILGLMEDATIPGDQGKRAAIKIELERVWKKYGAIKPVKLEKGKAKEIIKGKLFVVEKKNSSHEFTRNKARLVARGDMRKNKPNDVLEVFSPTVSFPTFLTTLNIILNKRYSYMVVDVESAYLNSKYKDGIYMKLEPRVADIMVEMDESAREYLEEDGSMYVLIEKALYGLQESAKLWYETLQQSLFAMGFSRSNYDHACYFKRVGNEVIIVLTYVDDMLITGPEIELKKFRIQLEKEYTINASELNPPDFDYVGIKVEYDKVDGAFLLSQPGMIKKVTEGITEITELPCDVKLYQETNETKLKNVTEYRSKLMETSYLAKTRYDLKVALGYLTTKMQEPTEGDSVKLDRVLRYINGTKEFKLRIKPEELIQVYASADASFGPFKDGKSNTGLVLTVGFPNAPLLAKSTKQKSVANSSTAAELIAFSTTLEEVLWAVELLNELGFTQDTVTIEQDNSSTMKLVEKGPSSTGRTKWINIKHFWVSEHLENGHFKLKYVPSLELLADGLTKPLGRAAFLKWRARILNHKIQENASKEPN